MSTVKANNHQVGQSATANQNFTLYQPATPDGTVRLGVGNAGATTLDALTVNNAGNLSLPSLTVNSNNISATNSLGFRNRIINGDMRVDQRNAGAAVTVNTTTNTYGVDRFFGAGQSAAGVFTTQRSTVAPAGFTNSTVVTVTTADASLAASGRSYGFGQNIEGFNISDLGWGAAGASAVTISFWVRSSVAGSYSATLFNLIYGAGYVASFTINSANTWEYKTLTIPGSTSSSWSSDNSVGIRLWISLGCGSSLKVTSGVWNNGFGFAATGGVDLISTNGATFYITGAQLEAGSVATPFERVDYGRQLSMCQRYYSTGVWAASGVYNAGGAGANGFGSSNFKQTMRAAPTITTATSTYNNVTGTVSYVGITADGLVATLTQGGIAGNFSGYGTFNAAIEL